MNTSLRTAWIDKLLLTPLEVLYGALTAPKKTLYHDAIKGYSDEELKRVFAHLRDSFPYQRFPSIADIHTARKSTAAQSGGAGKGADTLARHESAQDKRNQAIRNLSNEYAINFTKVSQTAEEANAEGWDWELIKYVHAVAHVQAQFIHPSPAGHYAIDWDKIQPEGLDEPEAKKWRASFFAECRRVARTGMIDVAIPTAKITLWKAMGANKKCAVAGMLGQVIPKRQTPRAYAEMVEQRQVKRPVGRVDQDEINAVLAGLQHEMPYRGYVGI